MPIWRAPHGSYQTSFAFWGGIFFVERSNHFSSEDNIPLKIREHSMTRTWLITGVTSGFGRLMAEKLLAVGDRVAGTYRRAGVLDAIKGQYGDKLMLQQLDVTDTQAVKRFVNAAFDAFGTIDIVVNNAGYGLFGAAEEVSDEQIDKQIATNLIGSIQVIRAALPRLRQLGKGRILQISSEGGQVAYPNFSIYHASKWGVEGFIESIAQEIAPFGIHCTIVEPGPSRTDFGTGMDRAEAMKEYADTPSGEMREAFKTGVAFGRFGDASKFADAIIKCAGQNPPPKRLTLGSIAYGTISDGLKKRLAELQEQRDICFATDAELAG
jgi:NAD(P)-dependent dehydrogenase (short-subunit alcohol dehydrogenase family)